MPVTSERADPIAYPPAGLREPYAARYVGCGPTKFRELVERGVLPRPRRIDGMVLWLRDELDQALADLPADGEHERNPWDE